MDLMGKDNGDDIPMAGVSMARVAPNSWMVAPIYHDHGSIMGYHAHLPPRPQDTTKTPQFASKKAKASCNTRLKRKRTDGFGTMLKPIFFRHVVPSVFFDF